MPVTAPFSANLAGVTHRHLRRRLALRCLSAALFSSLLLNLAYFPTAQGWLAWIALVPGLVLVRAELRPRSRYLIAWFAAWAFFLPALRWMRVAHETMVYSWIGLSLFCSWFAPVALVLIRKLDHRNWPLTLSVPVVWTALEFVRSHVFGGFPWYLLGYSQHDFLLLIQVADLAGVLGVTFLVAAVNGLLAQWLLSRPSIQSWFTLDMRSANLRPQIIVLAGVLVGVLAYGGWRLSQNQFSEGPVVALLQPDLDQDIRNDRVFETIESQNQELMKRATSGSRKPDLIIWAETTFPREWKVAHDPPPALDAYAAWSADIPDMVELIRSVVVGSRSAVLLGLNTQVFADEARAAAATVRFRQRLGEIESSHLDVDGRRLAKLNAEEAYFGDLLERYNSSLLVDSSGKVTHRYDKTHLVPFGEYVPLYRTFPFLRAFAPYAGDALNMLTPGEVFTRMQFTANGRTYSFGCMICYEDSYADIASNYVRGPEPVDFLVNQSNDGWFKRTQEHEEHLAVSRFRAIECRRALVRAVNMGISAVIDGNGRIVALPGPTWAESKGVIRVVSAAVPLDQRTSVYARTGDWLPWLCWLGITVSVVRGRKGRAA